MASSPSDMDVDAAAVEAETSLFESFASLPFAAGAQLHRDPHDDARLTLRVTTSQRDLVANKARRSVATMTVDKDGTKGASTALRHPTVSAPRSAASSHPACPRRAPSEW